MDSGLAASRRPGMTTMRKPAVMTTAGSLELAGSPAALGNATLTDLGAESETEACWGPRGLHDLGGDVADAGGRQADRARGAGGEVEHASLDEGAAVVDRDDDALAPVGDAQLGADRQRAMGGRHVV